VNLDSFTKVKAAMDKMLAELASQQKAEYEKGEQCKKDLDSTEDQIKEATNVKDDLDQKHTGLSNTLEQLAADIATLKKEVGENEVALKEAGEQRKANNQLFQQSMNDQRATITILNMAADRLKEFYAPKLVQINAHKAAPPPKPSGKNYEKQSGGVMQLLATIVSDAEQEESVLKITEQDEQKDYSEFVSTTTASIEADRKAIENKEEQKAQAEGEKSETEEAQLANDAGLAKLNELLTATHTDCDWILKYFDIRQSSRKEEMEAIQEAKAILSGANFGL
jgi:DNA repair exonuclease SbcCD ATPase subunit